MNAIRISPRQVFGFLDMFGHSFDVKTISWSLVAISMVLISGSVGWNHATCFGQSRVTTGKSIERQITTAPHGHILTNTDVWSADSKWIVYDVRSDPAGDVFDGDRIERVHVDSGRVELLYESPEATHCGVATYSRLTNDVVFIHGPVASNDWGYGAFHRRGVMVNADKPLVAHNLDARDLTPPFTAGALRGGTHVHTFSGRDNWVSFTYEDHVLATLGEPSQGNSHDANQRNVGISVPVGNVAVPRSHSRNHDGSHFTVLATTTVNSPQKGSDEISRAFSDAWIGTNGYLRDDGSRQRHAIAFQGLVRTSNGETIAEVFVVDLPEDITRPSALGPLEGTETQRPKPPHGTRQRRLTHTESRMHPGIQGARHWLRSSPDGSKIAFLMKDDRGVSQIWTVAPNGGPPVQLSRNEYPVASAFSWSPDGLQVAYVMNGAVCVTKVASGETQELVRAVAGKAIEDSTSDVRPEACVFSPDGRKIAYVRRVTADGETWNQVFVCEVGI